MSIDPAAWETWVTLVYLIIGFLLAALTYQLFSGGLDGLAREDPDAPCEDCGQPHSPESSAAEREVRFELDQLALMREHPATRWPIAVATALLCLLLVLVWPGVLLMLAVKVMQGRRQA